jgi:hypothetical protein
MAASQKKWSAKVATDSTHPPQGLFTKDPETIARTLAFKKVSPKGPGSGMRMLTFYINRAGKNLSAADRPVCKGPRICCPNAYAARGAPRKRSFYRRSDIIFPCPHCSGLP